MSLALWERREKGHLALVPTFAREVISHHLDMQSGPRLQLCEKGELRPGRRPHSIYPEFCARNKRSGDLIQLCRGEESSRHTERAPGLYYQVWFCKTYPSVRPPGLCPQLRQKAVTLSLLHRPLGSDPHLSQIVNHSSLTDVTLTGR